MTADIADLWSTTAAGSFVGREIKASAEDLDTAFAPATVEQLVSAIRSADLDTVDNVLLDVSPNARFEDKSMLSFAIDSGHVDVVRRLLVAGGTLDGSSWTSLHEAAGIGDVTATEALLKAGVSPLVVDSKGQNPLHVAVGRGNLNAATLLATFGHIDEADGDGHSALDIAIRTGEPRMVALMLMAGSSPNRGEGTLNPMHEAATLGNAATISLLLDAGADVEGDPASNDTPLMAAARCGNADVVSTLIARDANIEAQDAAGLTAFDQAILTQGTGEVPYRLMKSGAQVGKMLSLKKGIAAKPVQLPGLVLTTVKHEDLGVLDELGQILEPSWMSSNSALNRGLSALHIAARDGKTVVLKHLLSAATVRAKQIAFDVACESGSVDSFKLILKSIEGLPDKDAILTSGLATAVKMNRPAILELFISKEGLGMLPDYRLLRHAIRNNQDDILAVLLKHTADKVGTEGQFSAAFIGECLRLAVDEENRFAFLALLKKNTVDFNLALGNVGPHSPKDFAKRIFAAMSQLPGAMDKIPTYHDRANSAWDPQEVSELEHPIHPAIALAWNGVSEEDEVDLSLIEDLADVRDGNGIAPVTIAARQGSVEVVTAFLAGPTIAPVDLSAALVQAAKHGHLWVMDLLIGTSAVNARQYANPSAGLPSGVTPLKEAVRNNQPMAVMRLLGEHAIRSDATTLKEALAIAISSDSVSVVSMLIGAGASIPANAATLSRSTDMTSALQASTAQKPTAKKRVHRSSGFLGYGNSKPKPPQL